MQRSIRRAAADADSDLNLIPDLLIGVHEAGLEGPDGKPRSSLEPGESIRVRAVVEARRELVNPRFRVQVTQADGHPLFAVGIASGEEEDAIVPAGRSIELVANFENPLLGGRYTSPAG